MDIQKYLTPYKNPQPMLFPSGVAGTYNSHGVDCPFVFRHGGKFFMLHIGFNGRGYQTALAISDDLLHWSHYATILMASASAAWDGRNSAGIWIIRKSDSLDEVPELLKYQGKYWLLYHSYPEEGYEAGPAEMGLAFCEDEGLRQWTRLPSPVFSWRDGAPWEQGGLYKGAIFRKDGLFYMLYNAKNAMTWPWIEQTGLAVSEDLLTWRRPYSQPVLTVRPGKWDSIFVSDPYPVRDNGRWICFFFGNGDDGAQEGLAWSDDLCHWERTEEPIIPHGAPGSPDQYHAHKPCVVRHNGTLYHFYTGVRPLHSDDHLPEGCNEYRAIYAALSSDC